MKKIIILILPILLFALPLTADEKTKKEDIRHLLKITGSDKLSIQVMENMIVNMKSAMPSVPESFWTELKKEIHSEEFIELIVPIYNKYFTHNEIKDIIKFYDTPTGKKMIMLLPMITHEAMQAGENWGRKIGNKIIKKLKEKGYKK